MWIHCDLMTHNDIEKHTCSIMLWCTALPVIYNGLLRFEHFALRILHQSGLSWSIACQIDFLELAGWWPPINGPPINLENTCVLYLKSFNSFQRIRYKWTSPKVPQRMLTCQYSNARAPANRQLWAGSGTSFTEMCYPPWNPKSFRGAPHTPPQANKQIRHHHIYKLPINRPKRPILMPPIWKYPNCFLYYGSSLWNGGLFSYSAVLIYALHA